jgi:hypothetical protein
LCRRCDCHEPKIHALIQELSCIQTALTSLKEWQRLSSSNVMVSEEHNIFFPNDPNAQSESNCAVVATAMNQSHHILGQKLHAQVMALQLLLQVCQW